MILELPWPASELMPNRKNGKHWTTTRNVKDFARQCGYAAAKSARGGFSKPEGTIPLSILFCAPDGRKRDLDNLLAAMKPSIDGIAQALGIDDAQFRPIMLDKLRSPDKRGRVLVAVGVLIVSFEQWPVLSHR